MGRQPISECTFIVARTVQEVQNFARGTIPLEGSCVGGGRGEGRGEGWPLPDDAEQFPERLIEFPVLLPREFFRKGLQMATFSLVCRRTTRECCEIPS